MKQIRIFETFKANSLQINESQDGLVHLTGLFGETGTRNRNGRVYTKENYGQMIESLQEQVKVGLLGELEHPYSLKINLNNVSHKIDSLHMNEDGTCTGEITLLNTTQGKQAQALVEAGLPIFVSSRGAGTVSEDGTVTLNKLITFDIVATPSVENARFDVNESLCESIDEDLYIIEEETQEDEKLEDEKEPKNNEEPKQDEEEPKKADEPKDDEPKDDEPKSDDTKDDEDEDEKKVKESYIDYLDSLIEEIKTW